MRVLENIMRKKKRESNSLVYLIDVFMMSLSINCAGHCVRKSIKYWSLMHVLCYVILTNTLLCQTYNFKYGIFPESSKRASIFYVSLVRGKISHHQTTYYSHGRLFSLVDSKSIGKQVGKKLFFSCCKLIFLYCTVLQKYHRSD